MKCLLLHKVPENLRDFTRKYFEKVFGISSNIAEKIVSASPVILFDNLKPKQALYILKAFQEIINKGVKISIEEQNNRKEKKITWPIGVKINGRTLEDYEFASLERGFLVGGIICPRCGERLAIFSDLKEESREEKIEKKEEPPQDVDLQAEPDVIEQVPSSSSESVSEDPSLQETSVISEAPALEEIPFSEKEESQSSEENVVSQENISSSTEETATIEPIEEPEEVLTPEEEISEEVSTKEYEISEKDEPSKDEKTATSSVSSGSTTSSGEEKHYNLFLKPLRSKKDREKAVEILVKHLGMQEEEAKKLIKKPIISVGKSLPESEALKIKKIFEDNNIGINMKISHKK